jgi:hypothetical protein
LQVLVTTRRRTFAGSPARAVCLVRRYHRPMIDLGKAVILQHMQGYFGRVSAGADLIARCKKLWHPQTTTLVRDGRYHAGAGSLTKRESASIGRWLPPNVESNYTPVVFQLGRTLLYWFPDRLLIFRGNEVGAVPYGELKVAMKPPRFIEEEAVPSDATVVDRTWRYVNKSGAATMNAGAEAASA